MSEWITSRVVLTRLPHVCLGCLQPIPAGEYVTYTVAKAGWHFSAYYLCVVCEEWLSENPDIFEDGFADGDIGTAREEESRS